MNRIDEIVSKMWYASTGMGEVYERREEAALREWLADYDGEYTAELQDKWDAYCDENKPQYDDRYDE